jgi:hypothetical protein
MLGPAKVGVEHVARNETGPDAAGDRLQLSVTDQRAHVLLGAPELGGDVAYRQGCGPAHRRSIAAPPAGARMGSERPAS